MERGGAARSRREAIEAARREGEVAVLIVGGGINGAGLYRELAAQGVNCLLVDRGDFASGASSKSSRMIHGGLRYLENRELRLVRESLLERNRLLANAPHYVAPLKTTIPLFSWLGGLVRSPLVFLGLPMRPGGRGAVVIKLGLAFYDFATRGCRRTPRHFFTSRRKSLEAIPGLSPRIVATATYWDARITQAERLCAELLRDGSELSPGSRVLNYCEPEGLDEGGVRLRDRETGRTFLVRPRLVVNAAGAWVDRVNERLGLSTRFMGGTKGSHLVVDHPELHRALGDRMVYYEHSDGRICVVFPFLDRVIMGSTDIPVGDPDAARCDEEEVEYMLASLRDVFPEISVGSEHVVHRYCGVRPLPVRDANVPGRISRDHRIEEAEPDPALRPFAVLSLVGGKWTTFRALAEQAADRVLARLGVERRRDTRDLAIGGGRDYPAEEEAKARWIDTRAERDGQPRERVATLLERYGTRADELLAEIKARGDAPLRALPGYTRAEVEWIAREEQVVHLSDLVLRRSVIGLLGEASEEALEELAATLAPLLGWDPERQHQEARAAAAEVLRG